MQGKFFIFFTSPAYVTDIAIFQTFMQADNYPNGSIQHGFSSNLKEIFVIGEIQSA